MSGPPTTSALRVALCARIVNTCRDAEDAAWRAWLDERLSALPFERMGDQALINMAHEVLAPDVVSDCLDRFDATRYPIMERGSLCRVCGDVGHVPRDDGRWERCTNCNPGREPQGEASRS